MRKSSIARNTNETQIALTLELDDKKGYTGTSGIGFFDHCLTLFAKHGKLGLDLACTGDLYIDNHHTIEDLGIVLGEAFKNAIGDKRGIARYGSFTCPIDEALTTVDLDLSGRGFLVFNVKLTRDNVGDFETDMLKEFLYAFAINGGITLHVNTHYGDNAHHIIESIFKALARALLAATTIVDPDGDIPSTKGTLGGSST